MHNVVLEAGRIEIHPVQLIEFESRGRLLIIGSAEAVSAVAPHCQPLTISAVITDDAAISSEIVTVLNNDLVSLTGWLGEFDAIVAGQSLRFDLILDLSDSPILKHKVSPLGYFAPGDNQQALAEALQQLPELIGIFDKPRYFQYKPNICAHSRRGISGCNQCLEACPAEAISHAGDEVRVDPNLCQGCGSCVAVCPSGAMNYALPTLDVSLERLRSMMQQYAELETQPPHILIHDEANAQTLLEMRGHELANNVITFSIEEIGALSMPFWLAAMAYGAADVTVWDALTHSDHDWRELQQQMQLSNELLKGMGYPAAIYWHQGNDFSALKSHLQQRPEREAVSPSLFAGIDNKRRVSTMALSHLYENAPAPQAEIKLEKPSPFGEILVDKQACTLCMSCVSVCPVGALVDGVDKPQLNFIEDLCVQCGICETACPENAITLAPRYLYQRDQARQKRILHEEAIFHCISCAKPFATQKMIDTITAKLKDHHMFQGAALEQLKMCEDCRVKAMFKKG
ncbi:4Fe-4S dicluster domain-containing protein [Methylophaga sp. SB9B]|nr:4Fe-4S dicluster domain-containing protein [Methylophaga sp. SB9B]